MVAKVLARVAVGPGTGWYLFSNGPPCSQGDGLDRGCDILRIWGKNVKGRALRWKIRRRRLPFAVALWYTEAAPNLRIVFSFLVDVSLLSMGGVRQAVALYFVRQSMSENFG